MFINLNLKAAEGAVGCGPHGAFGVRFESGPGVDGKVAEVGRRIEGRPRDGVREAHCLAKVCVVSESWEPGEEVA